MEIIEKELKTALRKYIKDSISYTICPTQNARNGSECKLNDDACFFYDNGKCNTGRIELLKGKTFYEEKTNGKTDFGIYIG
jgi:hypothetical protein